MKHLIIGGSCRAGKSLLAKEILKYHPEFNYISTDDIRGALLYAYPEKNFDHENFGEFRKVVYKLYERNKQYSKIGKYMLMDGNQFSIDEYLNLYNDGDTVAVFVGKPQLSAEQYFNEVRENEKMFGGWTSRHSDEKLMKFIKEYHQKNLEECARVNELNLSNLFYLDTSFNQIEQIKDFAGKLETILKN